MRTLIALIQNRWTRWIGARHLRSRQSGFLNFITILSILGVAIGITAMIIVLSVMDGFEEQLKTRLMGADLHILMTPHETVLGYDRGFVPKDTLAKSAFYEELKSNPQMLGIHEVLATEAILKTGRKVSGAVVKGIAPERMDVLRQQLVEVAGEPMLFEVEGEERVRRPGLYVGREMAYMLGLIPGDFITMVSPTETDGPLESIPRTKRFVVEGIYSSGLPDQELHVVYTKENELYGFLRRKDVVTHWEMAVRDFDESPKLAEWIRKQTGDFKVQDWIQLNANLFASMKLERLAMFIILALTVVVASFNIVTTLTLMVLEKKKEISILKAMGARDSQVAAIFLSEGLTIGALGLVLGVILSLIATALLQRYEFIELPDIYYDRTLPIKFELTYYWIVGLASCVIVLLACLYPSRSAARVHPIEGIRLG